MNDLPFDLNSLEDLCPSEESPDPQASAILCGITVFAFLWLDAFLTIIERTGGAL